MIKDRATRLRAFTTLDGYRLGETLYGCTLFSRVKLNSKMDFFLTYFIRPNFSTKKRDIFREKKVLLRLISVFLYKK